MKVGVEKKKKGYTRTARQNMWGGRRKDSQLTLEEPLNNHAHAQTTGLATRKSITLSPNTTPTMKTDSGM